MVFPLLGSIVLLLAGCGTTGTTSRFALDLDPAAPKQTEVAIHVAPASMAPDASRLYAIAVKEWGRFNAADLANLEQSLAATISSWQSGKPGATHAQLDIHLQVRRYLVGISNTAGAVLACVTWAAVDPSGQIVFQEQFYAPGSVAYVGTIGGVKDVVHKAIVRRVATTSLYLAADPARTRARPVEFEGTYRALEDAISELPEVMKSMGNAAAMAHPNPAVGMGGLFAVAATGAPPWEAARPPADFDWPAHLQLAAQP